MSDDELVEKMLELPEGAARNHLNRVLEARAAASREASEADGPTVARDSEEDYEADAAAAARKVARKALKGKKGRSRDD
jgi:hypothetical protein